MKVSKNQIQNVSFSQKKEENVKLQQTDVTVQGGEEKMAKSLDCLASQVPVVKKDSFTKQKAELEERLKVLNSTTACNRFDGDDERFGTEGIKDILDSVDTLEKLDIVNEQLDILEDTKNPESHNVWAGTILALIDPEFAAEVELAKEEFSNVCEPTIDPVPYNEPITRNPFEKAQDKLIVRIYDIAFDENRMPVNDEDLEKLIELADTEEKIAYVNSKLDTLDTDVVFKDSPLWASAISEWLVQEFENKD